MKCPKCGYTSFDYLDECKKCGKDLMEHKEKHSIRSLMFPGSGAAAAPAAAAAVAAGAGAEGDEFGFDFMDEEDAAAPQEAATEITEDDTFDFGEEDDSFSFDEDDDTL